jgi:hypothetical protein
MSRITHSKSEEGTSASEALDAAVKHLIVCVTAVAGPAPALSAKDRIRSVKLRKGGEKVIPTITALSEQFGIVVPMVPTSAITSNLDKSKQLVAAQKQLEAVAKHLSDAIFAAQSDGWEGATLHYTVLKRLAKMNGSLETALAPVTQFFAQKSPAVVKAEEAKRGHRKGAKTTKVEATPAEGETNGAQASAASAPSATPAVRAP